MRVDASIKHRARAAKNEGIAIAPESQCVAEQKSFWWADDSATDGHALRVDTIACGAF
jgi:hypothetical protein